MFLPVFHPLPKPFQAFPKKASQSLLCREITDLPSIYVGKGRFKAVPHAGKAGRQAVKIPRFSDLHNA